MELKTAGIRKLEEKIKDMPQDSLRGFVLEKAKDFKTSWVSLGQALYSIWKDKMYRDWGYQQFDTYAAKEIGIKKETAMKLLRSYYFLEKDEPAYLNKEYVQDNKPAALPNYEAVNALRLAKVKKVDESDYQRLKKDVFENGKDAKEVKKDLTSLIREREVIDPQVARQKAKQAIVGRLLSALRSIKKDAELLKVFPVDIIKDTEKLIAKIEDEIS